MTTNRSGARHARAMLASVLAVGLVATTAVAEEPSGEQYRKAVEALLRQTAADEAERKQTAADRRANWEQIQQRREAEARAKSAAFAVRHRELRQEDEPMRREFVERLEAETTTLAAAIAGIMADVARAEAESAARFEADGKAFRDKFKEYSAEVQLAKAVAERERKKELARSLVIGYFTGGAGLPALAGGAASKSSAAPKGPLPTGVTMHPSATARGSAAKKGKPNGGWAEWLLPVAADGVCAVVGARVGKAGPLGAGLSAVCGSLLEPLAKKGGQAIDEYVEHLKKTYGPRSDPR